MPRFSLYLHIPYCESKCPYCDFNSYAVKTRPEKAYCAALTAELEHYAEQDPWRGGTVQTIYFGGGTPSLFAPESIADLLQTVRRLWAQPAAEARADPPTGHGRDEAAVPEITLEANPGTVDAERLRELSTAGVNRVSFGVQTFHRQHLSRLGRIHGATEAVKAIELAQRAGVPNVNLDLISAVPNQTIAEWDADLRTAIGLAPDHISAYSLTFEEGTAFDAMRRAGALHPIAEELEAAMFSRTRELLGAAGYEHYEISSYAMPGRPCRHNLNYWQGGEYLGVGAGAHSFSRIPPPGHRWSNEKTPDSYLARVESAGHARAFDEVLNERQARGEFVFLGLRCRAGFDGDELAKRFGADFLTAFPHAESFQRDGLLEAAGRHWRLTDRGLLLADSIFATFV